MRKKIRDRIFSAEEVTRDGFSADVILVFGAGYLPDGTPSDMLADRIRTGAELFLAGAGAALCLSGAVGADGHDEPAVMRRYALACGVPEDAIVTDPGGVSTYASVSYLARWGYRRALLVSQSYHLPRALDLALCMGIDARGIPADRRHYRRMPYYRLREYIARTKDHVKVRVCARHGKFQ